MHASKRVLTRSVLSNSARSSAGPVLVLQRTKLHRYYSQESPGPTNTQTSRQPQPRHEVHEGTAQINIPFNPPGGGGPNIGGSSGISRSALTDAALTTIVGLAMVFAGGIAYVDWYKKNVLRKIEEAFAPGYDPALELARQHTQRKQINDEEEDWESGGGPGEEFLWTEHMRRKEQDLIDSIVQGNESGHYFMLLGPKGTGKGTMLFDSMAAVQADGIAMCDAHPDLEVFRLRLGKALNYEFNEDSQTGLFQRRDPREGGAALDIERALNKLEKVAIRSSKKRGKPLVLILNNVHFFKNDDDGRNMLLQLQQKAEPWAASGILTVVFTSDDYWPFNVMRKSASRMHVMAISDLDPKGALQACQTMRKADGRKFSSETANKAVDIVGGRLSYLNKVSRARNMLEAAQHLQGIEQSWLLSQIGLIEDCDDDVMDEQKWSSCSWLLLQAFVEKRKEQEKERDLVLVSSGGLVNLEPLPLPKIPFHECRQIMTRTDFLEELDRLNIISIDLNHDVSPDSMLILHAARHVVEEENFQKTLDNVRDRIDAIESLHRTRELTFKDVDQGDRIRLVVDKGARRLVSD